MADLPRRFLLQRDVDPTGISGTGTVAEGVLWSDGTAAIHWLGETPSYVHWSRVDDAKTIHGHGGLTRFEWIDDE